MVEATLKRVVNRIVNLPTLPQVVSTIVSLTDDPNCAIQDVTDVISRDPTISVKILKLVNSAFYGFPSQISNLSQAVVILGLNTVRNVTLSASVFSVFKKGTGEEHAFDRTACMVHTSAVAFIAKYIAQKLGGHDPEEAFVGGLLHDIGKIILDTHMSKEFAAALRLAESGAVSGTEAEEQTVGTTHAAVGGWLIGHWKLPESLGRAVAKHHTPDQAGEASRLAALLCLSDAIDHLQNETEDNIDLARLPVPALEILSLEAAELTGVLGATREEAKKAQDFFSALGESEEKRK